MTTLITGAAGFIGAAVSKALLARGEPVIGVDNLNDYYSVKLKHDRLSSVRTVSATGFEFIELDFSNYPSLVNALKDHSFDKIVHLGAQAGVRYSIENPHAYTQANVVGHLNILELARHRQCQHLVYASSSSVYGRNKNLPFSVNARVDHPASLYAATKKADELISESYSHLFRLPLTGLRFFTVYGPWGRPDMAVWAFTEAILNDKPIEVYGHGNMRRDFTFIDDIVTGVVAALHHAPADNGKPKPGGSISPHNIYNIGNSKSEELGRLIELIERACGKTALRNILPMQPGDVRDTYADISAVQQDLGFQPLTSLAEGIPKFVNWYRSYASGSSYCNGLTL